MLLLYSSDSDDPSVFIRQPSVLDARQGVIKLLADGSDAAVTNGHLFIPERQRAHRADHRGRTGSEGFRQLVTSEDINAAQNAYTPQKPTSEIILGVDIGGGGDESVFVLRDGDNAWIETRAKTKDTMTNVAEIERLIKVYSIDPSNVFIDDIGVGRGVCDRLKEKNLAVNGVNVGDRPITEQGRERYFNIKAESYLALGAWIQAGGQLKPNDDWNQVTWIRYKVNSDKNIQIERKEKLKARVGRSPDVAEALMLTFTKKAPQPRSWTI